MATSFNLIHEPFIPTLSLTGQVRLVSISEALTNASSYRTVRHASPLVTVAIHRLLLAILQRIFGAHPTPDQAEWWREGRFPADSINTYFARWQSHFDLFNPERPFLQVPDFSLEISKRPWTALAAELSSGNNKLLFDHSLDDEPKLLAPAQAAQLLLACQCFSLSHRTVFKYAANAPSASAALIMAEGQNLFETLVLNLLPQVQSEHRRDVAIWEREQPLRVADLRLGRTEGFRGPAQLYAFPSRSLRLAPETVNGEVAVHWVAVASGVTLEDVAGTFGDPMASYRVDEKRGRIALGLNPDRAFWRDFQALRPFHGSKAKDWQSPTVLNHALELFNALDRYGGMAVTVCAQANDKAKIDLWRIERFALPSELLRDEAAWESISHALSEVEHVGKVLSDACFQLACHLLAPEKGKADTQRASALKASFPMPPAYWTAMAQHFVFWLEQFSSFEDEQARRRAWLARTAQALEAAWKLADTVVSTDYRGDKALMEASRLVRRQRNALKQLIESPQPEKETAL